MAQAHRNGDSRACGASTTVVGQDFVFVEGQLWSVAGDPNTHGGGALIASKTYIKINDIPIIVNGDGAGPDALCIPLGGSHCSPSATSGSSLVDVG